MRSPRCSGTLTGAAGTPIATYLASVWADSGFVAETKGIAEGCIALRAGGRSLAGSFPLPPRRAPCGRIADRAPRRLPLHLVPGRRLSRRASCGHTCCAPTASTAAAVRAHPAKTLSSTRSAASPIASTPARAVAARSVEVRRVQRDPALLRAVAAREPVATRRAVESLLNQHIVRLRVSAGGQLLSDVGGPYVLAPVRAPLAPRRAHDRRLRALDPGRRGLWRLTKRLAGPRRAHVHGPGHWSRTASARTPGGCPPSGTYHYRGRTFRVYTLNAESFPSGPLKIDVLIPIPYT